MRNREAETPVVPSVLGMIVVDVTGTTVVGVADNQAVTASFGQKHFKNTHQLPPPRFLTAIIPFLHVVHY